MAKNSFLFFYPETAVINNDNSYFSRLTTTNYGLTYIDVTNVLKPFERQLHFYNVD